MFTGIIEEIGKVSEVNPIPGGKTIKISAVKILNDIKEGLILCIIKKIFHTHLYFSLLYFCKW